MTFLGKPTMALAFGLFFLCAVTCAHFDQIATAPLGLAADWAHGNMYRLMCRCTP